MTNLRSQSCPSPDVLRRLCAGGLRREDETTITDHIDRCERCQSTLDDLGAGDVAASWLTPPVSRQHDSDELRQRLRQLKEELRVESSQGTNVYTDLAPWLEPGEKIGRIDDFDLLECVGRGGMGIVFRAHDNNLGRSVALKVLSPALLADAAAPERFWREARSAAGVNHPHVVTVHTVARVRELPYLVMEFVNGESLQQRLDRVGQLPLSSIIAIAKQTAQALAAAHATGVIHRDVKPANILLEATTGNAKLTDFGLARATEGSSLTRSGLLLGTPEYIAPEQVQGAPVDHRADLFSLGSVIYTMCSGSVPFRGPSIMSTMNNVCASVAKPVEQLNPNIPLWLSNLISSLHAKEPRQRPADSFSVVDAINRGEASTNSNTVQVVEPPPITIRAEKVSNPRHQSRTRVSRWIPIFGACAFAVISTVVVFMASSTNSSDPSTSERVADSAVGASAMEETANAETADELMELLDNSEPDLKIRLTSSEPYYLPSIEVEGRDVHLVAARGAAPILYLESSPNEAGLSVTDGQIRLEGLTIRADSHVDEEDESEIEGDDEDHESRFESLIWCEGATFVAINCRLVSRGEASCLSLGDSNGTLRNSEVIAGEADSILWRPEQGDSLTITNSVLIGETNIAIEDLAGGELDIHHSTCFGLTNIEVLAEDGPADLLHVDARASQFDAEESLLIVHRGTRDDTTVLSWNGERNLLPLTLASILDEEGAEQIRVETLDEWRRFVRAAEIDSELRVAVYRHDRQQLFDRLRIGILRGKDLQQLNANSRGAHVGVDWSAVGPDGIHQ